MPASRHLDDHSVAKRREQRFVQLRSELLRESGNRASFDRVKSRVLNDRDVQDDFELASLIRSFIAERETVFAAMQRAAIRVPQPRPRIRPLISTPIDSSGVDRNDNNGEFRRLTHLFSDHVTHLREPEAKHVLERIFALRGNQPDLATDAQLAQFDATLVRLADRKAEFGRRIGHLAERAVAAARTGSHEEMARAIRRLSSIHALFPHILADERFSEIREATIQGCANRHRRQVVHKMMQRERAIAAELHNIAAKIHKFHRLSRTTSHNSEAFRRAESDYHRVVQDVQSHDTEWLAAVIMELVDLLAEMDDPGDAGAQVDHFVRSVQSALAKLRRRANEPGSPSDAKS